MNDVKVIELLITPKNKINSHYKQIISKNTELKEYLESRYPDSEDHNETIYRIWKNIEIRPVCPVCGKLVKFVSGNGFRECCSVSCSKQMVKQSEQVITDNIIKSEYIKNGVYSTTNKLHPKFLKEHNYYDYLVNRYSDTDNIGETVYRICHDLEEKPKCVVCGKSCRFINHIVGYDSVCSNDCMHVNKIPDITDEYIKSLDEKGNVYKESWPGYKKVEEYLRNKFKDNYRDYKEAVYMVKHDMEDQPKCPICGKPCSFSNDYNVFRSYCSHNCQMIDLLNIHAIKLSEQLKCDISIDSNKQFVFKGLCDKHPEFSLPLNRVTSRCNNGRYKYTVICPICNPEKNPETSIELIVKGILDKLHIKYEQHKRNIISPKELDFYLPEFNIGIECNGMYWHSEAKKESLYHYNKMKLCQEKNIRLLSFWEYDIIHNTDKIKDIIASCCCKNKKIYARQCTVKEISIEQCRNFLVQYHLQGSINAKIKLGLFYNDKLIMVMTFGKLRTFMNVHGSDYDYELYRLCTKHGYTVIGGAGKLLKYFKRNYKWNTITSYSMNDISEGNVYEKIGFKLDRETKKGFFYYDLINDKIVNRYSLTKSKVDDNSGKSADAIIENKGYIKCYNCGTRKYIIDK